MTPHDELMALAGKAAAIAAKLPTLDTLEAVDDDARSGRRPCPITLTISEVRDLRALLDSDAFRAMVRDAGRWQHYASSPQTALALGTKLNPHDPDVDWTAECNRLSDAAIDAAASGAITPIPPTSEGEK